MKVQCLVLTLFSISQSRVFDPRENDINFKRFQLLITNHGDQEIVDLFADEVTVKASASDVTYYLYSKNNLDDPHVIKSTSAAELSRAPSHFDSTKKTVLIIHGWVDSYTADVNRLVKAAILKKLDVNIIVVDWSPLASQGYFTAQDSVVDIGKIVGNFINDIIDTYGINTNSITIIGHSLGAHIAGNAGATTRSKVYQIIGLDPAAPAFTVDNKSNRLDSSDAQYVQIIHSNGRLLGFSSSIGHADFYPNGGQVQAGCGLDLLGGCSHARAFEYLAEAIEGGKFTATLCGSYSDFQNKKCNNSKKVLLGSLDVDNSVVGDFFLTTNSAAPFAQG